MQRILRILERDARTSPTAIAQMLGMPEEDVRRVIQECEQRRIIRRHKTVIDWEKAGDERVYAFIDVKVQPAREVGFDDVAARIFRYPEVRSVYLVSGAHDLRVVVEGSSMKEVAFFVAEKLATVDRVQATATYFILKKYKEDGEVLAEPEEDRRLAVTP
ncbi:MAG: Lrp/AsnC family transcriptional regulator [Armatimonadetes bacterium]|nr:Lrp/AsnC family transcriptional regulator [Armatimonadota bacterium]